ncbi:MAG: hypothetical protein WD793_02595 [Steroidobacteraceae bacterium]
MAYEYIARGVQPIGQGLPGVANLMENRRRYTEQAALQREQIKHSRERERAADLKGFETEQLEHALAKVRWARASRSPAATLQSDPQAVEVFGKQGIDVNALTDEQAAQMLEESEATISVKLGRGPPAREKPGTLYKLKSGTYATPEEAAGQPFHDDEPVGAQGSWSQPFEATDPETGKSGMYQSHSLTGAIRPAAVGGRGLGPKPDRDDGDSVSAENAIFRQAASFFGGQYNPITGEMTGFDEKVAAKVQRLAARASRLYRERGGELSIAEAINLAANPHLRMDLRDWGPAAPAAGAAPRPPVSGNPAPRRLVEGDRAYKAETGQWIEYRGGRWMENRGDRWVPFNPPQSVHAP